MPPAIHRAGKTAQLIRRLEKPQSQARLLNFVTTTQPDRCPTPRAAGRSTDATCWLALAQVIVKSVPHDVPALAGVGVGFQVLETLVQHLSVPIRYRNLIGCGSDAFPQQLHVIDLLFDRELVEFRRWDGNRLGHVSRPVQDQSQV